MFLKVVSICQHWPARALGPQMESNYLKDWFFVFFKMAHFESEWVRNFEAIKKRACETCEVTELVG